MQRTSVSFMSVTGNHPLKIDVRCSVLKNADFVKGSLNGGSVVNAEQQQGDTDGEISFKVRALLTLAILSSELLLAFNITMVSYG